MPHQTHVESLLVALNNLKISLLHVDNSFHEIISLLFRFDFDVLEDKEWKEFLRVLKSTVDLYGDFTSKKEKLRERLCDLTDLSNKNKPEKIAGSPIQEEKTEEIIFTKG